LRSARAKGSWRKRDKSIRDERMVEALKMIREGRWTIRRAAKFAAVTYYEILDKMADEGIDSGPDLKDLGKTVHVRRIKQKGAMNVTEAVLLNEKLRRKAPNGWESGRVIREWRGRRRASA